MIPKHEDLGKLVTTDTEWYRPLYSHWKGEELDKFEEENNVDFCVVERDGCSVTWGFSKRRPLESLIEQYGNPTHKEEKWTGRYLGLKFPKNKYLIEFYSSDDAEAKVIESLPLVICNEGRCNGIINMEGDRCDKKDYDGKFCATCKKYNDKAKAGKLRECKYCKSTYHSTRSCEQNPKVIAKQEEMNAILRNAGFSV